MVGDIVDSLKYERSLNTENISIWEQARVINETN